MQGVQPLTRCTQNYLNAQVMGSTLPFTHSPFHTTTQPHHPHQPHTPQIHPPTAPNSASSSSTATFPTHGLGLSSLARLITDGPHPASTRVQPCPRVAA